MNSLSNARRSCVGAVPILSALVLLFALASPCHAACEPTDGITLYAELDTGGEIVLLSWTGGFPLFHVYRCDTPASLTDPECWVGDTTERAWSDVPPPGAIFFYMVTGVSCMPGELELCDCVDNDCDGTVDGPGSEVSCSLPHAQPACVDGRCLILSCEDGYGDCNLTAEDGCETSLRSLSHCGACQTPCALAHATESCESGTCEIAACETGYGNCDGVAGNGCERALLSDSNNCGACGVQCRNTHGTTFCGGGQCRPSCDVGWEDCDGNPNNGCETSLYTLTNCGGCGEVCDFTHATESCATGMCVMTGCETGWGDCNLVPADGCETNLNTNVSHCGACGAPCSLPHATPACVGGSCQVASCQAGWGDCDNLDPNGCERDLTSNAYNCGACNYVCDLPHTNQHSCVGGACRVSSCDYLWGNCNSLHPDGCETSLETVENCGGCGTACSMPNAFEVSCPFGTCRVVSCQTAFSECNGSTEPDGCEVYHDSDPACSGVPDLGTWCGDTSCRTSLLFCTSSVWSAIPYQYGVTEAWFQVHADECSSCSASVNHRITLTHSSGTINWDLYVYSGTCAAPTLIASSTNPAGSADVVLLTQPERSGEYDGFDYLVRVVWQSGASCISWQLKIEVSSLGTECASW